MKKIAIIGAGSIVFCKTLILDILATPALAAAEFALMAPSTNRTAHVKRFFDRVVKANNLPATATVYTNQREALKGADYVIATLQIGGNQAFAIDYQIPFDYGVDQCIGDTLGPGGIFRALRTIPVMLDFARDMEEVCPDAWFLNYTNPMCALTGAMLRLTSIKTVGLCHSVQVCASGLLEGLGIPYDEGVQWKIAGINHMAWLLEISRDGKDLYPEIKARAAAYGLTFKDPIPSFIGHAVCDTTEWLNGLSNPTGESYHPNKTGHSSGYLPLARAVLG